MDFHCSLLTPSFLPQIRFRLFTMCPNYPESLKSPLADFFTPPRDSNERCNLPCCSVSPPSSEPHCSDGPCNELCGQYIRDVDICSICDPSLMSGSMNELSLRSLRDPSQTTAESCQNSNTPYSQHFEHESSLFSSESSVSSSPCSVDCCKGCTDCSANITYRTELGKDSPTAAPLLSCPDCDLIGPRASSEIPFMNTACCIPHSEHNQTASSVHINSYLKGADTGSTSLAALSPPLFSSPFPVQSGPSSQSSEPPSPQSIKRIKGIPRRYSDATKSRDPHYGCHHSHTPHLHLSVGNDVASLRHSHHHNHDPQHYQKHNYFGQAYKYAPSAPSYSNSTSNSVASSSVFPSRSNSIVSASTTPFELPQNNTEQLPAVFYCHWGDNCEDSTFTNETDFDMHLKSIHLKLDENSKAALPPMERNSLAPKRAYDEHMPDNNDEKYLFCNWDQCNVELSEFDDLLEHIKVNHSTTFPHSLCNPNNSSNGHNAALSATVMLKQDATSLPSYSNSTTPTPAEILKCHWDNCDFNTNDRTALETHKTEHHPKATAALQNGVTMYQCEWKSCNYKCANVSDFMLHVKQDHVISMFPKEDQSSTLQEPQTLDVPESPHLLQLPNTDFQLPQLPAPINNETETESKEKHICQWCIGSNNEECGCVFNTTQELNQHVVDVHVGSRKNEYICNWAGCERHGRPFTQRQKIHRHLITHTKNKPYVCDICGNSFSEALVLKQHLRVHSGEKPFACKICNKRFAASTALSVHMRTHTGEKPLVCKWPGCDKRFSESSNLAKHMKSMYFLRESPFLIRILQNY